MAKCTYIEPQTNRKCGSEHQLSPFYIRDPNHKFSQDVFLCKKHVDVVLHVLKLKETELYENTRLDWEKKKELRQQIRWGECRRCGKSLSTKEYKGNVFEEVWLIIVLSQNNKFRYGFHFHRKCCFELMERCGIFVTGSSNQGTLDFMIETEQV
jgi:hypothetical protein